MKSLKILTLISSLSFILLGCSNEDDNISITSPEISYSQTQLTTTFLSEESSSAPNINWNGEQGNLSIVPQIDGLSINGNSGVLSWSRFLKPGNYNFQVIASNSAGQKTIDITLENEFEGTFTGTYDNVQFFEFEFFRNGEVGVRANSETSPDIAVGTWEFRDEGLYATYSYQGDSNIFSTLGDLTVTSTQATYNGNWYFGEEAEASNGEGTFELSLN